MEQDYFTQKITDVVPQIIWTNDQEGNANYFNQRWYEYTGLTYEDSEGGGWVVVAHEEDIRAVEEWRKAFREKRMFEAEARLRNKEGKYEWHLLRNVPFSDGSGNVIAWFGSATNIQSLKDAEAAFRKTSTYLRAILDSAVDFSVLTMDENGIIIGWTGGAEKMFGYSEEEVLGQHSSILFTMEDRAAAIPKVELQIAKDRGRSLDERWHVKKDGSRFFMSGVLTPMKGYKNFVKITRDITDRKLAEEALLLAEHRSNMAMESAQMGEWSWNLITRNISIDEKARSILSIEEGNPFDESQFWKIVHSDDLARVEFEYKKAIEGLNIFQSEMRIANATGNNERWINWYGRVVAHAGDVPKRMIGVVYDVSERKALEKQKDDFISLASHELKTPITTIKGYSELLHDFFRSSGEAQNADLIEKLNGQIDRLINLINVLLDTTRITQGKLDLNMESFDLNGLLEESIRELKYLSRDHKLVLQTSSVARVHADRERIGQVITNLVSNAVKYSPAGQKIIISTEDGLDGAVVKVQDFGMGISPEEQTNLFRQYYRGSERQRNNQPGFGLGLYISSEIIRQHHGLIGVNSTVGEGSTFYFKLFYT